MAPTAAGAAGAAGSGAGGGGPGAGGRSSRSVEEQHVWIYCASEEETESILSFCRDAEYVRRIPEENITLPEHAHEWRAAIKLRLHEPPPSYGVGAWKEFLADADSLLGASCASVSLRRGQAHGGAGAAGLETMRWPRLLVTDRRKLCQAVCDDVVRTVLAEAARLQLNQILPVVLAADFKMLCGYITEEAPLDIAGSVALADGQPPADVAHGEAEAETFQLATGVYIQSCVGAAEGAGGGFRSEAQALGARCLAVLGNGRCAYSAVSADGLRRVDATGPWEVVNGHLLVGGATGRASFSHSELAAPAARQLAGLSEQPPSPAAAPPSSPAAPPPSGQQPVIVSLEELRDRFEPPVPLSECVARMPEAAKAAYARTRQNLGGGRRAGPRSPAAARQLSAEVRTCSSSASSATADCLSRPRLDTGCSLDAEAPRPPLQPVPPSTPRTPSAPSRPLPVARDNTAQGWDMPSGDQASTWTFATCPLRPGAYRYEVGQQGSREFRLFNLILNVDGSYFYRDHHFRTLLSATSEGSAWQVRGGVLTLSHRRRGCSGRPGFLLTMHRGKREVERRITRVEIPLELIRAKCTFIPHEQDATPFPGHEARPAAERLGGFLDTSALSAIADPPLDPEFIPLKDFEDELQHLGLDLAQEGITDLNFIDRDGDGRVAHCELVALAKFGAPVAASEVVAELSESLLQTFGALAQAFEFMQQFAGAERITFENFDGGLHQVLADKKLKNKCAKLKQWLKDRPQEEMEAVFSAVNPQKQDGIGLDEFSALGLHTALLALRHLEEFQAFLFNKFGREREALLAAFEAIDVKHKHELTDKTFLEGIKKIGYKHADANIFGLLDMSFSGKVTPSEFLVLGHFSAKKVLDSLQELKDGALRSFGSLGDCFQRLLEAERQRGKAADGEPALVSPGVFAKEHEKGTLGSNIAVEYLPLVLLFLGQAGGRQHADHMDGTLTLDEWRLLQAFDATFLSGLPMRLRECLETRFGDMEGAFARIQGSWLPRLIGDRLKWAAVEGLLAVLPSASPSPTRKMRSAAGAATSKAPVAAPASARTSTAAYNSRAASEAKQRPHTHCGVRSHSVRDGLASPRGAPVYSFWPKPGPCKQVKVMCEARMPTPVRSEHWTLQPRQYQAAWPVNEDASGIAATPRRGQLPGLAAKPLQWERPGAISAINWGVV